MSPQSGAQPPARAVWYVVILLATVNMFSFMDRMALAVLAGPIQKDIQLSDTQLGLLTGFAFSLFYALCGIPIACLADRANRRNIVALALTVWSLMTALTGAAQNFWQLFLARVGVAVGEAGGYPPGQSIICDYVPFARRAGALAIHMFGNGVGAMVGMGLAGWLGATLGWRLTFVALGLPGLVLAVIVRYTLREPARGMFDAPQEQTAPLPFGQMIAYLMSNRSFRQLLLFAVWGSFAMYGLVLWWPLFYVRVFGLDLSWVGAWVGIAIGAGSALGGPAGGFIADRLARRNAARPLQISAGSTLLTLPAAVGSLYAGSGGAAVFMVFIVLVLWSVSDGPVTAARLSVIPAHMRATASAVVAFVGSVLGAGLAPLAVGVVGDLLVPALGTESLRYALLVPICFIPLTALTMFTAARTLPKDLQAVGVQHEGVESRRPMTL